MKIKLQLTILVLFAGLVARAQVSGTFSIPGATYSTIASAIAVINASGVGSGGVTFNVSTGYTETFPSDSAGWFKSNTSTAANPVVFQKSGSGANPKITAGTGKGTRDAIISFRGVSYITFDGIDIQENPANADTTTRMEFGYGVFKASGTQGSQHITIKNCSISLTANYSTYGILHNNTVQANTTQLTVTALSGTNSYNVYAGITVTNCNTGIYLRGFNDPTAPYLYYDRYNDVGSAGGNTVTGIGQGGGTSYGIIVQFTNNYTIANNTINGTCGVNPGTGIIYGIYNGGVNNPTWDVHHNTINIANVGQGSLYAFLNGSNPSVYSGTTNFYNNSVTSCSCPNMTTGSFYGVYTSTPTSVYSGITNYYNNSVTNCTLPSMTTGTFNGIYISGGFNFNLYNNTVSNITYGSATATATGTIMGIYTFMNPATWNGGIQSVHDNTVTNINRIQSAVAGSNVSQGIYLAANSCDTAYIYNNLIDNINDASPAGIILLRLQVWGVVVSHDNQIKNCTANGTVNCYVADQITNSSLYPNQYHYNNTIRNITTNGTTKSVYGLMDGRTTNYWYNNFVSELKAPNSNNTIAVCGAAFSTTKNYFYNNTIYLDATTVAATFSSAGIFLNGGYVSDVRNNIIVNTSASAGTGKTAALMCSSVINSWNYAPSSNNNLYYAGTPGPNNLIYYDGTNSDMTLQSFKTRVFPRDNQSVTENPPFINVSSSPYDIRLKTNVLTQCEGGGTGITNPVNITTDHDGQARYPYPGYPNNPLSPATSPDMGADEFGGLKNDVNPPVISFTPLGNTSLLANRTLTTTVSDPAGVPVSGLGLPRLYWKKNAGGTWNSSVASWISGNSYSFTLGSGVVMNDSVYYYIVAQDAFTAPNSGSSPTAPGCTANPPACSPPPANSSCYSYKIMGGLCGTYNVGVGQTYATLTAAIADLNQKPVDCPVVFQLTDNSYTSETFPIVINNPAGVSATNTVTIRPAPGVDATISGVTTSAIIQLNQAHYIIIDGSSNGSSSKNLTISNTAATGTTATIWIGGGSLPSQGSSDILIKNCKIKNGYRINTSYGIFIGSNTTLGNKGEDNDNITIQNNSISKALNGIYAISNGLGMNDNLVISGNLIGSADSSEYVNAYGIYIAGAEAPQVTGNEVFNLISGLTQYGSYNAHVGICLFEKTNYAVIKGNYIHDIHVNGATGSAGNVRANGILIGGLGNTASATNNTLIANNLIRSITTYNLNATNKVVQPFGIRLYGGGVGTKIYHNTVVLDGAQYSAGTAGTLSACLSIGIAVVNDVRDNIFINDLVCNPNSNAYCVFQDDNGVAMVSKEDYNDLRPSSAYGKVGYCSATYTVCTTLSDWQTNTGQDLNSFNTDPILTNMIPTNLAMGNLGNYVPIVPKDYAGVFRTNPPDVGAYEFSLPPTVTTNAATGMTLTTATLNGVINPAGKNIITGFEYGLTTSYGTSLIATPSNVSGNTPVTILTAISGLAVNTTYHFRAKGLSGGLTVYGNDLTFTTLAFPPVVVTTAATSVGSSGATLNGTVNPNGASATVSFDYGLTTAYGSTVTAAQSPINGSSAVIVNAAVTGLLPFNTYHFRVKSTNSGGTSYGGDLSFTTNAIPAAVITNSASNVNPTTATLNGSVNPNYATATVSFDWGLTTAYGNNVTATPASVSGSTSTPVLVNIVGLSWATTYHFRCVGVNAGGTAYGADMVFNTACPTIPAPGSISGPAAVCQNQYGVTYSVALVTNASGYTWTVPTGATISGGQGSNNINVNYSTTAVSGNVTVTPTNTCSSGPTGTFAVTVNPMPVPAITGPATACAGYTNYVYNTQAGMTGYAWTVSAGGSITAGAGTSSITVTWLTTGAKTVTVNYNNANGCTAVNPGTYSVTVNALPNPTITGNTSLCAGSGYYTYTTESGMSGYTWTISSGGAITAGQSTSIITVLWNNAGAQTVSVNYNNANGCQALNPTVLNITVNDIPAAAGSINGTTTVCAGQQGVPYSVASITGAQTYVWTLPTGATIASGAGTSIISVNYAANAVSGAITVQGNNLCGSGAVSPALNITVTPTPAAAGSISGPTAVCQGENGVIYTVPAIANASGYTWTAPNGATITSGANTNTIHVDFSSSASSGSVTVLGSNACGTGASSSLSVIVNSIPPTPSITANGYVLTSSAANGNQWYHDGTAVAGATSQTYTVPASAPGWYWTVITVGACSSDQSNHLYIQGVGIGEHSNGEITIYPVPNDGRFNISISSEREVSYKLDIYNSLGVNVYGGHTITVNGTLVTPIDLGSVASGLYTVVLRNTDNQVIRKILINK